MKIKAGPLVWLVVAVSMLGALVALPCAGIAVSMYRAENIHHMAHLDLTGMISGSASGFVAGLLWCAAMIPIAVRFGPTKLGRIGALCGLVVGSFSTLILHVALAWAARLGGVGLVSEGLLLGIPVGLVVGAICGTVCRAAVRQAVRGSENARWTEIPTEKRGEA